MNDKEPKVAKKLVSALILWCMVAGGLAGIIVPRVGSGSVPQDAVAVLPSTVSGYVELNGVIYDADYGIKVVNGGTLKLVDSTLNFQQDDTTDLFLDVATGGALVLENSTITTGASQVAMWDPFLNLTLNGATFKMTGHSVLAFPGWLNVTSTRTYVNDSWITSLEPIAFFTDYANAFPTFKNTVDNWWAGTDRDLDELSDDGPVIRFEDCTDVTIADSRIDELYENEALPADTPFNVTFAPSVAATAPAPVGDVTELVNLDLVYMDVLSSPTQILTIGAFNTAGFDDLTYDVNSVWLQAEYNTTYNGVSGYNGNDYVQWRLDAGVYANAFQLDPIADPWAVDTFQLLPAPSISQMSALDVRFANTDPDADATVFFDRIRLIANIEPHYDAYPTMVTLDNTDATVINSYVAADWRSAVDEFGSKNGFHLTNGANLYMYNTTISEDEPTNGVPDYIEIPIGANAADYVPFRVEAGSQAYYYKWLEVPVTDRYDLAVPNAYINATFRHTDKTLVNQVSRINDLTKWPDATWQAAKKRVADYLGRQYGVTQSKYNVTREDGKALLPLLTTFINSTNYPNGDHVGEYDVKVNYTGTTSAYSTCDFVPVPNIAAEENSAAVPVQLAALELPRPIGSMGLIVNDNEVVTLDGISGEPLSINDFIIVEDNGVLTLARASVLMAYSGTAPYEIIVRGNGQLVLNDVDLKTANNLPLKITLEDTATLSMIDSTATLLIDIEASGSTEVTFVRSTVSGNFDVPDGSNVVLTATNTLFGRSLDNFGGTSTAVLTGCYSPLSPNFIIAPSEDAEVWIYRYAKATVYDGVIPAHPLEGAAVAFANEDPVYGAGLGEAGTTGADGVFSAPLLSDYIYYNDAKGQVAEAHYNLYNLMVQYSLNSGIVHTAAAGFGVAAYPSMGLTDATSSESVVLENVLPDLDPPLTIWPAGDVGRGDAILINATVTNTGDAVATGVTVRFQDVFEGVSETIQTNYTASLAPGESWDISFPYVWTEQEDIGQHNITVSVDPNDSISEQNETNNTAFVLLNVTAQADLTFTNMYDVTFSTTYPIMGLPFTMYANVWNLGDLEAVDVVVSFYELYSGDLLGNVTADLVPASLTEPTQVSLDVTFPVNGTYAILVVIDGENLISEVDETNNNNSVWPRVLRVWDVPDLYLSELEVVSGTNQVEIGLGGGTVIPDTYNRTTVTLRARVENTGELFASGVYVQFYDGATLIGTSNTIANINTGSAAYATYPWLALTTGLQQAHNIRAIARASGDLVSNELNTAFTVYDDRPDLSLDEVILANNLTQVTADTPFYVNVTMTNHGMNAAEEFAVEIYSSTDAWNSTLSAWASGQPRVGRIGNATVASLAEDETVTLSIRCTGIAVGDNAILINIDPDLNGTDVIGFNGVTELIGDVEEYNERNNNDTLAVTAIMPDLVINLQLPAPTYAGGVWTNVFKEGETTNVLVTGTVVRSDMPNVGVQGIDVSVQIQGVGSPVVMTTGAGGFFSGTIDVSAAGNYTITATGAGASDTTWFRIDSKSVFPIWIIIVIIIIVVAVIGGITGYLYFVGLGKTVQCGDCGAFIPEGAAKCPKCGVEFETEVAKCSVCGAWVPIDVKNCPECGTEFTVGTEALDDYEAKMKRQYEDVVRKFREQAKKDIGREFTETEFQAWWAKQPTFMTFDQWLKEEEEMKRMGSRKCPVCDMENSVTAKICHKCGSVMGEPEAVKPKKPEGKAPQPAAKAPAQAVPQQQPAPQQVAQPRPQQPAPQPAPQPVAAQPTQVAQPAAQAPQPAAQPGPGKKLCPSCGVETNVADKVCPICNFNFEQPDGAQRIIRKPIKKIVRRPGEGGEQGGGQQP